ncbi:Cytochrome P450 82A3 [Morus notabilis]|uniref:Cytochrome P450 82A3 n=1 Tax=Morus notabilis TaxID=981085 RepID=W9QYJ3_9ROSA|nr:cytochrome P450 CYP82D47 [Morus notabilis]EXB51033.1 Cytochrome P450 82A3 [Morus notabilis]
MEFLLRHIYTAVAGFLAMLLFLYSVQKRSSRLRRNDSRKSPPEAAGRWPIIGHLHLLGGSQLPHITLANLADKCGPIFTVRIGSHPGLVVSSSEMAKECFTINDLALASRPNLLAAKHMGYNYAMFGLAPHGPFWREIRKIATVQLLSNRRLELLKHIRISEVASFVKELYEHWTTKWNDNDHHSGQASVEMKQRFLDLSLNVILRMVAGKRYSVDANDGGDVKEARLVQKEIKEFFKLLGLFVPGDAIPYLGWLDLGGCEKAMKKTAKALDGIVGEWLEEHKQNRAEMNNDEKKEQDDFMDVMLSVLHGSDFGGFDADTIIKATILNMIAGGSDTIPATLTWAVSLLLNNHHVLKKAQEELENNVGKNRVVSESDIGKLTYIFAIVKETLRLYPVAPLSVPHVFLKDCTIGGYHVAKGTRLITNIWKIQTNPILWPDPFEFKPERFLTTNKDVDIRGQHFELIPFGSGRRACPGTSFALQMVQFTLASFLQAFDISTPLNAPVDMTESFGLTNTKATPLEVLITPRLPAELYA